MKAIILNCTLKKSPEPSSTEALANVVAQALAKYDVESEMIRVMDHNIPTSVKSDEGNGDEWPIIREKILAADILILASPTWMGRVGSVAQRVIERMDGMLKETDEQGRPVAYNHVGGCVVTGNEDGAKHVIAEMSASMIEIGFTVPGHSWTYYNQGAPMGPAYIENDNEKDKERSHRNAGLMAHALSSVARALQATPIPPKA